MNQEDIERYAEVMKEIKNRVDVIALYLAGKIGSSFRATKIEAVGLQFRKTFEQIAFSSLIANRELYSKTYASFAEHWEAAKLVKNLRTVNPHFYPVPVVNTSPHNVEAKSGFEPRPADYLTEIELVTAHGRCGALMHAANPFAREIDYPFYEQEFPLWLKKTMNLLIVHQVHLVGDSGFYHFNMKEEGHDNVGWYRFEPVEPIESS